MKALVSILLLTIAVSVHAGGTLRGEQRTLVEVTSFTMEGNLGHLEAQTRGDTFDSQLVVLVRYPNRRGLYPALNQAGEPALPESRDTHRSLKSLLEDQQNQEIASTQSREPNANVGKQDRIPFENDLLFQENQAANQAIPVQRNSHWSVDFVTNTKSGRILQIFAILCTVKERQGWSRARDYSGFMYLPFSEADDIQNALEILRDFGWLPTGYTRIEP